MAISLNETQRQQIAAWLNDGAKLSEIQDRLAREFGLHLTYMEVRLLVDDLKLTPKDVEPSLPAPPLVSAQPAAPPTGGPEREAELPGEQRAASGEVSVTVDQIARPGAVVSGRVTFRDGQRADWYLDQMGRLGLIPQQQGYKPSPPDVQEFQMALQEELARMGF